MIAFTVYGVPVPKGSMKAFYSKALGHAILQNDNAATKPWAQEIAGTAMSVHRGGRLEGAISLSVRFYLPRPKSLPKRVQVHTKKPDLDKLARNLKDSLTGVLWKDDAQVVEMSVSKVYAGGIFDAAIPPRNVSRAEISVTSITQEEKKSA